MIKQIGKRGKLWIKTRKEWIKLNPPNFQGYWTCDICKKWTENIDLDHIKKRGSHPELLTDLSNLRPLCRECHIKET
jgi:5-methylcytosine-specific restriction enzyme A